jgi:hypothetical protein
VGVGGRDPGVAHQGPQLGRPEQGRPVEEEQGEPGEEQVEPLDPGGRPGPDQLPANLVIGDLGDDDPAPGLLDRQEPVQAAVGVGLPPGLAGQAERPAVEEDLVS